MSKKFNYKEQHAVVVICKSEKHQQRVYEELKKGGHTLKVVST
jgi:hypothetical protein